MNRIDKYTSGQIPVAGSCGSYDYCANAMAYKPYDVSGLASLLDSKFNSCMESIDSEKNSIVSKLNAVSDAWGEKFIEINGSSLNFIHHDYYVKHLDNITNSVNSARESAAAVISSIISGTEAVNAYLEQLQSNYNEYQRLTNELNSIKGAYYQNENDRAVALSNFYSANPFYDSYVDIGEPDGTWVVG